MRALQLLREGGPAPWVTLALALAPLALALGVVFTHA